MKKSEKNQRRNMSKIENGVEFLRTSCFHDAKLLSISKGEKYGKPSIVLIIDFKNAENPPKAGRLCEITLLNGRFSCEPERKNDCYILSLDCLSSEDNMRVRLETEYFAGSEERRDFSETEFSDAEVLIKTKKTNTL